MCLHTVLGSERGVHLKVVGCGVLGRCVIIRWWGLGSGVGLHARLGSGRVIIGWWGLGSGMGLHEVLGSEGRLS